MNFEQLVNQVMQFPQLVKLNCSYGWFLPPDREGAYAQPMCLPEGTIVLLLQCPPFKPGDPMTKNIGMLRAVMPNGEVREASVGVVHLREDFTPIT